MRVELVCLPRDLQPHHLHGRSVVVFDVLRATTSMVAALFAGAREIVVFDSLPGAADAARQRGDHPLLCGEQNCLAPAGFDLGNSPGAFTSERCSGRSILMSTTNGTRAIVAAHGAGTILAAALVNATATARHLAGLGRDVTLVCAGTNAAHAAEDAIGAGAVVSALRSLAAIQLIGDGARSAYDRFLEVRAHLPATLRTTQGGRNIIAAGLEPDIDFAARLDVFDLIATINDSAPPVVTRHTR